MVPLPNFHGHRERKKSWRGVFLNAGSACRLVELGQRRSGEVAFFFSLSPSHLLPLRKRLHGKFSFPYNGVCSPGVYFNPTPYNGDFRLECSY